MSINLELKNKIKKHIRKYITVVFSLLFLPLFSINSYAAQSVSYPQYDYNLPLISIRYVDINGNYSQELFSGLVSNGFNTYCVILSRTSLYDEFGFHYYPDVGNLGTWEFPYIDSYDYYFTSTCFIDSEPTDLIIEDFKLFYSIDSVMYEHTLSNKHIVPYSLDSRHGYTMFCKIDSISSDTGLFNHRIIYPSTGLRFNSPMYYNASVFVVPKGDKDALNNIVAAINNQTSQLGGKLDGIDSGIDKGNDLIENGNSGTESTITDFNEVFEDFNTELENIEKFDSQIIDEFESANDIYLTELNNFSLSASLLNAGNWLSTSMQTIYDSSSDYKMLWLVPLLLGIPLLILFVRKGDNNE